MKAQIYPAKMRFYSPGRWEAWNKFPNGDFKVKNFKKIKKTEDSDDAKSETKNYFNETLNKMSQFVPKIAKKLQIDNFSGKNNEKKLANAKENHWFFAIPEKYSYSAIIGDINIIGRQISPKINHEMTGYHTTQKRFRKTLRKKFKNIDFKLPEVITPSPWLTNQ